MLEALARALAGLQVEPWRVVLVSGIGQAGKMPHHLRANFLHGLHGRTLAHATGVKLANPELVVIAIGGDGDIYGEGGGHLLTAFRRNIDITCLVHNNGVYGLTKGQASPTAGPGVRDRAHPAGVVMPPFNPMAVGLAAGGTFLARGFAGEKEHLAGLFVEAVRHRGFGLVDVLQPCVTYNRVNTLKWYEERLCDLAHEQHDPTDRAQAFERALEWPGTSDERVPFGVFYRAKRDAHESRLPALKKGALSRQGPDAAQLRKAADEFR